MHIVYSVFSETSVRQQAKATSSQTSTELLLRLAAHEQVCVKYQDEIAAIRKYMPHWQPTFNVSEW